MPKQDKLFICVKSGWAMNFSPIGLPGWKALGWWTISLLPIVGLFVSGLAAGPTLAAETVLVITFLAALGLWTWAMIRWMLPRSEVIEAKDISAYREARARRSGRRQP